MSGRGNKRSGPETEINAGKIKSISGKFTLLPLASPWPALADKLVRPAGQTGGRFSNLSITAMTNNPSWNQAI